MDSLSFCLSEKVPLSFISEGCCLVKFFWLVVLSFDTWKMLSYSLLACKVSAKQSIISLRGVSCKLQVLFSWCF